MHLRLKMIVDTLPCYVLRFNRITQQHSHLEVRRILIAFVIKILHSAKAAFRMTTHDVLHYNKAFSNPPFSPYKHRMAGRCKIRFEYCLHKIQSLLIADRQNKKFKFVTRWLITCGCFYLFLKLFNFFSFNESLFFHSFIYHGFCFWFIFN